MMPGYKKSIVNFIASRVKRDILDAGNRETKEIFEASRVLSAFIEVRVASVNEAFQLLQHPQFFRTSWTSHITQLGKEVRRRAT